MIGGIVFAAGYFCFRWAGWPPFISALVLIFIGNGFFKPNISTIVGNFYPAGSPLRDAAYNIFYMGINIGAFLAPVVSEVLAAEVRVSRRPSYPPGSAWLSERFCSAFSTAISFTANERSRSSDARPRRAGRGHHARFPRRRPLKTSRSGNASAALVVIFAIVIVFWMVFHQNGSTMTYWANDNTDWRASTVTPILIRIFTLNLIDGSDVSGVISNAINPFWIIVLSIPLVRFWSWLNSKGLEPSTPMKMAIGMLLTCGAFLVLAVGGLQGRRYRSSVSLVDHRRVLRDLAG